MNQIKHQGNLPGPIRSFGLFGKGMDIIWSEIGYPEIWECNTPGELGKLGHLDDCEFQVLIDKDNGRYYLVAMSVDPDRVKTKVDASEFSKEDLLEDEGIKPVTIVYYTEIGIEEYRIWQHEDRKKRVIYLKNKAREEDVDI